MSKMAPAYNLDEQEDEAERLQVIFGSSLQNLIEAKEYLWTLFLNRDIILFSSTSNRSWFSFLNSLRKNTTVIWKGKRRLYTANSSGFHSLGREKVVTQANPGISTADGSWGVSSSEFSVSKWSHPRLYVDLEEGFGILRQCTLNLKEQMSRPHSTLLSQNHVPSLRKSSLTSRPNGIACQLSFRPCPVCTYYWLCL